MVAPRRRSWDEDLAAARAAPNKRVALDLLMDRFGDEVLHFAAAMMRDAQLAEDIRQKTFVAAYCDFEKLEDLAAFPGWIMTIARHRCLDAVNARKRWRQRFTNEPPDDIYPPADGLLHNIERSIDLNRISSVLAACISKLAQAARLAVVLRYVRGLSYEEVAAIVGEQPGTVQRRVSRALPVLRKCVKPKLQEDSNDL